LSERPRAKPQSVWPPSRASSIASVDGADTAQTIGMPARRAFWTISKEVRPLTCRMQFESGINRWSSAAPTTLSTALWRPTSSRATSNFPRPSKSPAACSPPVRAKPCCASRSRSGSSSRSSTSTARSPFTGGATARSSSIVARPQTPQLVEAVQARRRTVRRRRASVTRTTLSEASARHDSGVRGGSSRQWAIAATSSARSRIPSAKRRPRTSSRSCPGVRITTPSGRPSTRIESGSSCAIQSSRSTTRARFARARPAAAAVTLRTAVTRASPPAGPGSSLRGACMGPRW